MGTPSKSLWICQKNYSWEVHNTLRCYVTQPKFSFKSLIPVLMVQLEYVTLASRYQQNSIRQYCVITTCVSRKHSYQCSKEVTWCCFMNIYNIILSNRFVIDMKLYPLIMNYLNGLYLGQVFGNSSPSVSIWNFRVLQVHCLLPNIFIQEYRTIMRPWGEAEVVAVCTCRLLQSTWSLCSQLAGGD